MGPTEALCKFTTQTQRRDIPADIFERTLYITLDGIGCALFGAHLDWSRRAVEAITEDSGPGNGAIFGWSEGTAPTQAALLNGTFIQGSELDDIHPYPLHSCACVLPAVFGAVAHNPQLSGEEAVMSIALGFETGPRIARAMGGIDLLEFGWHCGSIYGAIASGVAASRALGLNDEQTEDAVSIGGTQACGLMSAQFEAMVKRMHSGFAARSGLTGAILARKGFTGIKAVLERDYGGFASTYTYGHFDLDKMTSGLGEEWLLGDIVIKPPYGAMGCLHSPIEMISNLKRESSLSADDIESVKVWLPTTGFKHAGWKLEWPPTVIGAQMNVTYAVAKTLLDGEPTVVDFGPHHIERKEIWALMDKVEALPDENLDTLGNSGRFSARVEVTTKSGEVINRQLNQPRGQSESPFSNEEIVDKFRRVTRLVTDKEHQEEIISAVLSLPDAPDTSQLLSALRRPVRDPFATVQTV